MKTKKSVPPEVHVALTKLHMTMLKNAAGRLSQLRRLISKSLQQKPSNNQFDKTPCQESKNTDLN